uniref:TRPM-like domain-containing protein n=1 Tax=Plectus sambesii TaxID=2011161 RepID=A0A914X8X5_9BILA
MTAESGGTEVLSMSPQTPDRSFVSDTIAVRVSARNVEPGSIAFDEVAEGAAMQVGPAVFLPSIASLPSAVKHIYTRLASTATTIDGGVADIVVALIGAGCSLSSAARDTIEDDLKKIVELCDVWIVTSGLDADPLARMAGRIARRICEERVYINTHSDFIRQQKEDIESKPSTQTVLFAVNSSALATGRQGDAVDDDLRRQQIDVADCSHTYFVLLDDTEAKPKKIASFRAQAATRLAHPPPAVIIGVPDERYAAYPLLTPTSSSSQAIIFNPNREIRPIAVVLFAGGTLASLCELRTHIEAGTPVVVLQDASELCAILNASWTLYRGSGFEHDEFMSWLDAELRDVAANSAEYTENDIEAAKNDLCKVLSSASDGSRVLLSFRPTSVDSGQSMDESLLGACLQGATDMTDVRRLLRVLVKLDLSSVAYAIDLSPHISSQWCFELFEESLKYCGRNSMTKYLLDSGLSVAAFLNVDSFERLLRSAQHQDFFQTVILGHCLGYPQFPNDVRRLIKSELNHLLEQLAGLPNVIPSEALPSQAYPSFGELQMERVAHNVLCYWALLMNREELAKLLWAYSHDPIPLALSMSRICNSLAHESRDWYFFERKMTQLSKYFSQIAVDLLHESHKDAPHRSYDVLCHTFDQFGGLTATGLAYQSDNKAFLAHECCQRWVSRLLYGNVHLANLRLGVCHTPSWLKVVLSAVFVAPIWIWVRAKPEKREHHGPPMLSQMPSSPTIALLENGQTHNHRRFRTQSNQSMVSVRSLREETLIARGERAMAESSIAGRITPSSMAPINSFNGVVETAVAYDDNDGTVHIQTAGNRSREDSAHVRQPFLPPISKRHRSESSVNFVQLVCLFYSTPIAKYWMSLICRLAHLVLFGWAVSLPGCGSMTLDLVVWVWAFIAWVETLWVLFMQHQQLRFSQLNWHIFDTTVTFTFLLLMLFFKIIGNQPEWDMGVGAFWGRVSAAFFLLYLCYSTLFIYVPMSSTLGPLMVRVKLMIIRDFLNYLLLIILVMASAAVVVHAIIYPDYASSPKLFHSAFSWAWFSLFTTDLSGLTETDTCEKYALQQGDYCSATGGYANPQCPTQSWMGYFAVIQYLIILKLISYPLLFALFAKTAKEVDDEADQIWKHQLYGLATDFSIRPPLPPPFTPLAILVLCLCRTSGCLKNMLCSRSDHPDVADDGRVRFGNIYRSSQNKDRQYYAYWKKLSLDMWKRVYQGSAAARQGRQLSIATIAHLKEQLRVLINANNFSSSVKKNSSAERPWTYPGSNDAFYPDSSVKSLQVNSRAATWSVLLPHYNPPVHSKPSESFASDIQKFVDPSADDSGLLEIKRLWRQRQALGDDFGGTDGGARFKSSRPLVVSCGGLPLNPSGRKGIAGRGNLARFGPNNITYYVILTGRSGNVDVVLDRRTLPHRSRYDGGRYDEHLAEILKAIGQSDLLSQSMASTAFDRNLPVGASDGRVGHVAAEPIPSPEETDNAWLEIDVWAFLVEKLGGSVHDTNLTWSSCSGDRLKSLQLSTKEQNYISNAMKLFALN